MDFKGNPFGPMPNLMATAEYVTKVHAVCTRTGNLAQFSYRKTSNEDLVMLGETEEYEPLSRGAFYKARLKEKLRNFEVKDPEELKDTKRSEHAESQGDRT
jgi:thymidine kinase